MGHGRNNASCSYSMGLWVSVISSYQFKFLWIWAEKLMSWYLMFLCTWNLCMCIYWSTCIFHNSLVTLSLWSCALVKFYCYVNVITRIPYITFDAYFEMNVWLHIWHMSHIGYKTRTQGTPKIGRWSCRCIKEVKL